MTTFTISWPTTLSLILATAILYCRKEKVIKFVLKTYRVISQARQGHHENRIKILHAPDDADIDIIAVPGLGAHPIHTWSTQCRTVLGSGETVPRQITRVNWLQDANYLRSTFPRARIMVFCYNAGWFYHAPVATLKQRAAKLLRELHRNRSGQAASRSLIFIGHSLGGVLLKQALCTASLTPKHRNLLDHTLGCLFLGTPHLGSRAASLASKFVGALTVIPLLGSKATLLKTLCSHSTELSSLRNDFSRLLLSLSNNGHRLKLYSIIETLDTYFLGFIPLGLVVDRDSGTIESGYDPIEVDTDHKGLNKCCSTNEELYVEIVDIIRDIVGGECLKAFASVASNLRQQDPRIHEAVLLTGTEVRSQPAYLEWQASDTSDVLWIVGKMGTGKSTLLKRELHESQKANQQPTLQDMLNDPLNLVEPNSSPSERSIVVSYFYSFSRHEVQAQAMLQSLIFQLLYQERRFFPALRNRWRKSKSDHNPVSAWPVPELASIFLAMLNFHSLQRRIEIFVDALDESHDSQLVLEILRELPQQSAEHKVVVKVLAASRHSHGMTRLPETRQIILENHNSDEIRKVIQVGISSIHATLQGNRRNQFLEVLKDFEAILTRKAQNTILWVSLTLHSIKTDLDDANCSVRRMMEALEIVPDDLEMLYKTIVDRFRARDPILAKISIEDVKYRLLWAAYAGRNLTLAEYFHAVALRTFVPPHSSSNPFLDSVLVLNTVEDARTALSHCGGFLDVQTCFPSLTPNLLPKFHLMGVQLTHGSVLTFLHKPVAEPLRLMEVASRLEVLDACIAYLDIVLHPRERVATSRAGFAVQASSTLKWGPIDYENFVDYLDIHPLLCYVWSELDAHFEATMESEIRCRLDRLHDIYHTMPWWTYGSLMLNAWIVHVVGRHKSENALGLKKSSFRVWMVEMMEDAEPFEGKAEDIRNRREPFWRQTMEASIKKDCFASFKTLCQIGILSQFKSLVSLCAEYAISMNNFGVLDYLGRLQKDQKLGIGDTLTRSFPDMVVKACELGNVEIANWLLDSGPFWGINLKVIASTGSSALFNAAQAGQSKIVESLLEHGADADSPSLSGTSPLKAAAQQGHLDIVKLLIRHGAERGPYFDLPVSKSQSEIDQRAEIEKEIWVRDQRTYPRSFRAVHEPVFFVPRKRLSYLFGRESILEELHDAVSKSVLSDKGTYSVALTGMAGIGNSSIATEFAYRIRSHVDVVLWINAESADSLLESHREAAGNMGRWDGDPNFGTMQYLRWFYTEFVPFDTRVVVIWDKVHDFDWVPEAIFITRSVKNTFHVVITQYKDIGKICSRSIEVPRLTVDEGVLMLSHQAKVVPETPSLRDMVEILGALPVSLALAGMFLRRNRISPQEYLDSLPVTPTQGRNSDPFPYLKTLFQAWETSITRLSDRVQRLLSLLSMFEFTAIPNVVILRTSVIMPGYTSVGDIEDDLSQLSNMSLIHTSGAADKEDRMIELNQLVARFVVNRQNEVSILQNQRLAIQTMSELLALNREFLWRWANRLMPHALKILSSIDVFEHTSFAAFHILAIQVSWRFIDAGQWTNADRFAQWVRMAQKVEGNIQRLQVMELTQIEAAIAEGQCLFERASHLFGRAYHIGMTELRDHRPQLAVSIIGMARIWTRRGDLEEATKRILEARSLFDHTPPEDKDPTMEAKILCTWATILSLQGRKIEAEVQVWKALDIAGADTPDALEPYCLLASLLAQRDDIPKALDLARRALALAEAQSNDLNLATALHALGKVYYHSGRYEEAETNTERALKLRKSIFLEFHPDRIASEELLASINARFVESRSDAAIKTLT